MVETRAHVALLYHFARLRLPTLQLGRQAFGTHLERAFARYLARPVGQSATPGWEVFVENLHTLDFFLAASCLDCVAGAWEALFRCRASRTEALLLDALNTRAIRLFPRDEERQQESVQEFWGYLLTGPVEGSVPILARYDGQRPLVPWLICVFQNKVLSEKRRHRGELPLPDEDLVAVELDDPEQTDGHWHEQFREVAREWFHGLSDREVLLLGLRLRYQMSQREVAHLLGIHEGNISRAIDTINKGCRERVSEALRQLGWSGDDLSGFIRKEMASLLLDEPALSADRLAALLAARGKSLTRSE